MPQLWGRPGPAASPTTLPRSAGRYLLPCNGNRAYLTFCVEDAVNRGYFSHDFCSNRRGRALFCNHPLSIEAIFPTDWQEYVGNHVNWVTILCQSRLFFPHEACEPPYAKVMSNHPLSIEAIFPTKPRKTPPPGGMRVTILCQSRLFSPQSVNGTISVELPCNHPLSIEAIFSTRLSLPNTFLYVV